MAEKCYFLSDLHLGSAEEPKAFLLLNFLKQFNSNDQITHLFLMGDIFDMWLADHSYYIKKFQPIVNELHRIKQLGVSVHYFEGNHDMFLEHYFEKKLNFAVHKGPALFDLCGIKVRVEHGDQMDPDDWGYRALRWFWRTPLLKWLAPRIPEFVVVWIGDTLSSASREYNSEIKVLSDNRARELIHRHAIEKWQEDFFDLILCGHVHVMEDFVFIPELRQLTSGHPDTFTPVRVVNLGSWYDRPKAFLLTNDRKEFLFLDRQ